MEEDAYRIARRDLNTQKCAFEKALLTRRHQCTQVSMFFIANRHGCNCKTVEKSSACFELLDSLRKKARFALHLKEVKPPLPHAKEIRVQLGGLVGLNKLLNDHENSVRDISALIAQAYEKYPELKSLPYDVLVAEIQKIESLYRNRRK